jgi:Protein of unknown function (DUF2846)
MFRQAVVLSLLAIVVAGCAHARSGADFASLSQKIGPPKAGQARIVVFREQAYTGVIDQGWDVKLDGAPLADLKAGTFAYADRPAGRHQLTSEMALFPGVTQRDITVAAGRTHFFLAKLSERSRTLNTMSAVGGLAGYAVGSAMTSGESNPGPLEFIPMEESAAREAIADLRSGE